MALAWAEELRPAPSGFVLKPIGRTNSDGAAYGFMIVGPDGSAVPALVKKYKLINIGSGVRFEKTRIGETDETKTVHANLTLNGQAMTMSETTITRIKAGGSVEKDAVGSYHASLDTLVLHTNGTLGLQPVYLGIGLSGEAQGELKGTRSTRLANANGRLSINPIGLMYSTAEGTTIIATTELSGGVRKEGKDISGEFTAGIRFLANVGPVLELAGGAEFVSHVYFGDIPSLRDKYMDAYTTYKDATQAAVDQCSDPTKDASHSTSSAADMFTKKATKSEIGALKDAADKTRTFYDAAKDKVQAVEGAKEDISEAAEACKAAKAELKELNSAAKKDLHAAKDMDQWLKTVGGFRLYLEATVRPKDDFYFRLAGQYDRGSVKSVSPNLDILSDPRVNIQGTFDAGMAIDKLLPH